ncbi:hypothetical protein D3C81_1675170 [compost metagenome]
MGNGNVNLCDIFDQRLCLTATDLSAEIARETFFQVLGFTHIDHRPRQIIHAINARLTGYGFKKCRCIKTIIHCLTMSPR